MWHRSSAVPHSLLVVDSSFGHKWVSLLLPEGTVLEDMADRLFRFFAVVECRVRDASSLQVCSQATVSCSQPEYSSLFMSCQTADWVCRGVVVSSGPSPLTSLTVSEQGFGFLVSGGGQGVAVVCFQMWPSGLLFHFLESYSGLGSTVEPRCILEHCLRSMTPAIFVLRCECGVAPRQWVLLLNRL